MLALHGAEVYRHRTLIDVAQPELLVVAQALSSPVGRPRIVALPRSELDPGAAGPRAIAPRRPRTPTTGPRVVLQAVLVGPPLLHGLAVAADAPEALPALGPVHGRAFLGLADVRALLVAAPEVGARVVQLQTEVLMDQQRLLNLQPLITNQTFSTTT